MSEIKKQLPRVDLPPGTRLDTLAVREGISLDWLLMGKGRAKS